MARFALSAQARIGPTPDMKGDRLTQVGSMTRCLVHGGLREIAFRDLRAKEDHSPSSARGISA